MATLKAIRSPAAARPTRKIKPPRAELEDNCPHHHFYKMNERKKKWREGKR